VLKVVMNASAAAVVSAIVPAVVSEDPVEAVCVVAEDVEEEMEVEASAEVVSAADEQPTRATEPRRKLAITVGMNFWRMSNALKRFDEWIVRANGEASRGFQVVYRTLTEWLL